MPDANDFLKSGGENALRGAIYSAEVHESDPPRLDLGSDQEVAECLARDIKQIFGHAVYSEGNFYVWEGTHWSKITDADVHALFKKYDGREYTTEGGSTGRYKISDAKRKSVRKLLTLELSDPKFFSERPTGVSCESGFIALDGTGAIEVIPHDPLQRQRHYIITQWVQKPFNGFPASSLLRKLCSGCFSDCPENALNVNLMGELIGAAVFGLATKITAPKTVILLGETAANGKSQWLSLLRALLPVSAVSSVPPSEMDNEQRRAQLAGVLLNTADELGPEAITSDKFKAIVSGDRISGKIVYREPFEFVAEALHVFATNVLPEIKDGMDRGVRRRLQVLTFDRTIPHEERIANIGQRAALEEIEILFAFAIDGARRLMRQGKFTETSSGNRRLAEWVIEGDQVAAFFEDDDVVKITGNNMDRLLAKEVYKLFDQWSQSVGLLKSKIPTQAQFTRRAKTLKNSGFSVSRIGKSGNRFNGIIKVS